MSKISLDLIVPTVWNSRIRKADDPAEKAATAALAESFKKQGQLQAVTVEDMGDGKFLLVFGNRRFAAARVAGWADIEATVRPLTDDNRRMLDNLIENVKRKNLTSFEEARGCAQMRAAGLTNDEIAATLGFSMQKVSNYAVTYSKLPDPILQIWKDEAHPHNPIATDRFLRELATEKNYPGPEKKMQAWDERVAKVEADKAAGKTRGQDDDAGGEGEGEGEGEGGEGTPTESNGTKTTVSQARLNFLIGALSTQKGSPALKDNERNAFYSLLMYLIKQRDMPPVGVPVLPVKPKAIPLTEEEKAAAKAKAAADRLDERAKALKEKAEAARKALPAATVTPIKAGKAK